MGNPEIVVEYIAKTTQLQKGLGEAERSAEGTGKKLKGMGRMAVAAAGAAGLAALVGTLKIGVDEMSEAAKVGAQTEAVLKSTGGAAKVSAGHVADLAGALMEKSGVDDEAIQSGENLLLTFTNIRNGVKKSDKVFDQTTKTMLDMSVALGQDTKTSAIQLGKALNDPIKGVTKLQKVGVTFTDAQKEQIKTLTESGDTMGAQKVILQELQREFGGSAEAAGKTLPGQIAILKESFNNLAGDLVKTLVPALQKITGFFVEHPTLVKALVFAVLGLAAAMVVLNVALAVTAVVASPVALIFIGIAAALAGLIVVVILVWKHWGDLVDLFEKGTAKIQKAAKDVFDWLKRNWPLILGILTGPFGLAVVLIIRNWGKIEDLFAGFVAYLRGLASTLETTAKNLGRAIVDGVVSGLVGIGSRAWGVINNIGEWIAEKEKTITSWGVDLASALWKGITSGMSGIGQKVGDELKSGLNAVLKSWNALKVKGFTIKGPGPLPDIHFPAVNFPNIPLLAKGGIVTGPTLAMLGERGPEAVIPLSGSAGQGPIEVRVFIGDTELKGLVRSVVLTQDNRTAQVLLAGSR